jgi:hypothetical protein
MTYAHMRAVMQHLIAADGRFSGMDALCDPDLSPYRRPPDVSSTKRKPLSLTGAWARTTSPLWSRRTEMQRARLSAG